MKKINVNANEISDYVNSAKNSINSALEQVKDGQGLKSHSMSVMMMAFGSAIGSVDMLAAINAELQTSDAETQENVWEEFQDVAVLLQAATELIEDKAKKINMAKATEFRDARADHADPETFDTLIANYNHYKTFQ